MFTFVQKSAAEISTIYNIEGPTIGIGPLVFTPLPDGDFLPKDAWNIMQEGSFNHVKKRNIKNIKRRYFNIKCYFSRFPSSLATTEYGVSFS